MIGQHTKSLRTDLLIAADSLTSAMSSLVQQLNTGMNQSERERECNASLTFIFVESTESLPTAIDNHSDTQTKNGFSSFGENGTDRLEQLPL